MKMIKSWGAAGRSEALRYVTTAKPRRYAPEAIWRQAEGRYCHLVGWGGGPRDISWGDIPGTLWATATLTVEEWYRRYGGRRLERKNKKEKG